MAMPFDAMLNNLIDEHLLDWTRFLSQRLGLPDGPAVVLDTDLATNLRADRLFRIEATPPYLIHLELESSAPAGQPARLLRYNVLARYTSDAEVFTVIMLLRPKANSQDLTGFTEWRQPHQVGYLGFRYAVIKIWEEPMSAFLGQLGLLPLALLTNEAANDLRASVQRLHEISRAELAEPTDVANLMHSAYILGGLRYADQQLLSLFSELSMKLEESSTYQALMKKGLEKGIEQGRELGIEQGRELGIEQGRLAEAHESILALGPLRLGEPDAPTVQAIEAIQDLARLKRMQKALFFASSWQDILQIS